MAASAAMPSRGFSRDSWAALEFHSEPISGRAVQVIGRELAAGVRGLEPPELDSEHQRPAGAEIHVPLAHDLLEPAPPGAERVGHIALFGIVDPATAADHHPP